MSSELQKYVELKVKKIDKQSFGELAAEEVNEFLKNDGIYFVEKFFSQQNIMSIRKDVIDLAGNFEPAWYPMADDSPHYHNINNENPDSVMKQRVHRFQFHLWHDNASHYRNMFRDLNKLKRKCSGIETEESLNSLPSTGRATVMGINHFPKGGGYMTEHLDKMHKYEPFQTIIKASTNGKDYRTGGLQLRLSKDHDPINVDEYWDIGDLVMFNSGKYYHQVSQIDPNEPLTWSLEDGRFTICIRTDNPKTRDKVSST